MRNIARDSIFIHPQNKWQLQNQVKTKGAKLLGSERASDEISKLRALVKKSARILNICVLEMSQTLAPCAQFSDGK